MNEQIFATLQNVTYTRSDLAYAIGIIKALIEFCFFFNDTATTEIYTLSLHDALPISCHVACDWHYEAE